jgi:hypothetical protein
MCGHSFHPRHAKTAYPGAPVWRNGRVGLSFLVYTINKDALVAFSTTTMRFTASTVRLPTTRCGGVRCGLGLAVMRWGGVRGSLGLAVMRWGGVRGSLGLAVMRWGGVRLAVMRHSSTSASGIATPVGCPFAVRVYNRWTAVVSVIAHEASVISSAAGRDKAMAAPTVVVTPAGPWTHAQEDAVIEVARPVITNRGAGIRCITVVAVRTDRWRTTYVDGNLRIRFWRQGQRRK